MGRRPHYRADRLIAIDPRSTWAGTIIRVSTMNIHDPHANWIMATELQIARQRYAERFGLSEYRTGRHTVGLDADAVNALADDPSYMPPFRLKRPDRPSFADSDIAIMDAWRRANQGKPATLKWLYGLRERGTLALHLDRARA
ncbi:hypothetical protein [Methylorubrum thiocyanatum]|uniref:hypothetical protein n=1 Tax=Methylorubrum thiocyanatum TaxID=47958 RepID=UPI003650F50E